MSGGHPSGISCSYRHLAHPKSNLTSQGPEISEIGRVTEDLEHASANQVLLVIKYIRRGTEISEIPPRDGSSVNSFEKAISDFLP